MHFLMPHVFQSHVDFKEWFSNPLSGMIEGSREYNEGLIKRLHKVSANKLSQQFDRGVGLERRFWQTSSAALQNFF